MSEVEWRHVSIPEYGFDPWRCCGLSTNRLGYTSESPQARVLFYEDFECEEPPRLNVAHSDAGEVKLLKPVSSRKYAARGGG